jgi:hypothetical protein
MGFRNPLTTISAENIAPGTLASGVIGKTLETGPAGTPRVAVYQHPTLALGIVEFDPAVSGESTAQLSLSRFSNQPDGSSGGNNFNLRGSAIPGVYPPALQLRVDRTGPGTYQRVAYIDADRFEVAGGDLTNFKVATPVIVTNAAGEGRYTFPVPYPVGCFGATVGSAGAFGHSYTVSYISADATGVSVKIGRPDGSVIASTSALITVIAVGR